MGISFWRRGFLVYGCLTACVQMAKVELRLWRFIVAEFAVEGAERVEVPVGVQPFLVFGVHILRRHVTPRCVGVDGIVLAQVRASIEFPNEDVFELFELRFCHVQVKQVVKNAGFLVVRIGAGILIELLQLLKEDFLGLRIEAAGNGCRRVVHRFTLSNSSCSVSGSGRGSSSIAVGRLCSGDRTCPLSAVNRTPRGAGKSRRLSCTNSITASTASLTSDTGTAISVVNTSPGGSGGLSGSLG